MITGQVEAAFARLIGVVKRSFRDERNQARVRLLELFETLGNSDERVLNARRDNDRTLLAPLATLLVRRIGRIC
jgi:putative thioredoxin